MSHKVFQTEYACIVIRLIAHKYMTLREHSKAKYNICSRYVSTGIKAVVNKYFILKQKKHNNLYFKKIFEQEVST